MSVVPVRGAASTGRTPCACEYDVGAMDIELGRTLALVLCDGCEPACATCDTLETVIDGYRLVLAPAATLASAPHQRHVMLH